MDKESAYGLGCGMRCPTRWDPFSTGVTTVADVYRYPTRHYGLHRRQVTLAYEWWPDGSMRSLSGGGPGVRHVGLGTRLLRGRGLTGVVAGCCMIGRRGIGVEMADQERYFAETLDKSIDEQRRRKDFVRRLFWALQITVMLLGTLSTVLLGVNTGDAGYVALSRNLVLCFSALAALLTGLSAFWNLEIYWLKRKAVLNRLVTLRREFEFRRVRGVALSQEELQELFTRYLAILDLHAEYWDNVLAQAPLATALPERSAG